jgi:hypothetical protein
MLINTKYLQQIDGRAQSIKRAYDNGTHGGPAVVPSSSIHFPFDMAVDPYARLLYWTCANTNAINVTRLDNGSAVGVVVKVNGEKPRNIALHPERGYVKHCKFIYIFLFCLYTCVPTLTHMCYLLCSSLLLTKMLVCRHHRKKSCALTPSKSCTRQHHAVMTESVPS